MKITLEDCVALSGLTETEVLAIAEHEHIPEIAATALANYLLSQDQGTGKVRDMIVDDIRQAQHRGDKEHVRTLLHVLHHFIKLHPEAAPAQHPWSGMPQPAKIKQPEIPEDMREMAVQGIEQAHAAFGRLLEAGRRTQETMKALIPQNPVAQRLNEAQERAMRLTQQNLDATFALASELARARDLAGVLQALREHSQLQMQIFALQAQELAG
ncbi:MAG: hypothetical protein WCD20_04100 [Rhodomicrobium sp.]